jgi:membrane protease YdiL (CAAX protease family)
MNGLAAAVIVFAATAIYGYLLPRFVSQRFYTLVNLSFGVLAVAGAGWLGASRQNLGLVINQKGLFFGAVLLLALITAALGLIKFRRQKLNGSDYKEILLRIPFGTALAEELIFRSSIMGCLLQNYSRGTSLVISSVGFGFWHLLPGEHSVWAQQNPMFKQKSAKLAKISGSAATVITTFIGGLIFGGLRLIAGSIVAPWAAHTLTNVVGWLGVRTNKPAKGVSYV